MADRGPVKIRGANINRLIALYKQTEKNIFREIIAATTAGKIQKFRVMNRINAELATLGVNVEEFVQKEIPQYYRDGANVALQDLRRLGVDVSAVSGFATINAEAIGALTDETSTAFAESMTAMSRNARNVLNQAVKEQISFEIAEGRLRGEAIRTVKRNVVQRLEDEGIAALTDRAGKRWKFDVYAENLIRTKAVEARNQGLANRMLALGYDLVQVTNHGSTHAVCRRWEGAILSLTGKTPGYPTVAQARADGLFHPNCEHAINVLVKRLADKTKAYDSNVGRYREPSGRFGAGVAQN